MRKDYFFLRVSPPPRFAPAGNSRGEMRRMGMSAFSRPPPAAPRSRFLSFLRVPFPRSFASLSSSFHLVFSPRRLARSSYPVSLSFRAPPCPSSSCGGASTPLSALSLLFYPAPHIPHSASFPTPPRPAALLLMGGDAPCRQPRLRTLPPAARRPLISLRRPPPALSAFLPAPPPLSLPTAHPPLARSLPVRMAKTSAPPPRGSCQNTEMHKYTLTKHIYASILGTQRKRKNRHRGFWEE